jgi:hypothetical protein
MVVVHRDKVLNPIEKGEGGYRFHCLWSEAQRNEMQVEANK